MSNKLFLFLLLLFTGCESFSDKLYIKSVQQGDLILDWYIYSEITSFSPAKVQICRGNDTYKIIEFGHGITNVDLVNDCLMITTHIEPEFEVNMKALTKLGLTILYFRDSPFLYEDSSRRLGKLHEKKVDVTKRHFENTD